MAVVVTGGSGFIGSHLVDELIIRGEEVHIVDNMCVGTYHPDGASHYLLSVTEPSLKSLFESIQPRTVSSYPCDFTRRPLESRLTP